MNMRFLFPFTRLALILGLLMTAVSSFGQTRTARRDPAKDRELSRAPIRYFYGEAAFSEEAKQLTREGFVNARAMLIAAGLPFDPDLLLELDYPRRIPESFRETLRAKGTQTEGPTLSGVYLADTLFLPGSVDLEGDTVLLARRIVFDSSKPTIWTHFHGLHMFQIETIEHTDPRYAPGHFVLFKIAPEDESQARQKNSARRGPRPLADGAPGRDGLPGATGDLGRNGVSGANGANGNCFGDKNGAMGNPGEDGQNGGIALPGGRGFDGGPATAESVVLDCSFSGPFSISAQGGRGGDGGAGGRGGAGGSGGAGGGGGNGGNCDCPPAGTGPGSGGQGGQGGAAGTGGSGNNGGDGGNGGAGANITVTRWNPAAQPVSANASGGVGGNSGTGGGVGAPGLSGAGGAGGARGISSCGSGSDGTGGIAGGPEFGSPITGVNGASGSPGPNGTVSIVDQPQCSSGPPPPPPEYQPPGDCNCSPILIDLDDVGFRLSGPGDPVSFDIDADGRPELITWTSAGSRTAFLVLDRNGNGSIDDGSELFGNHTRMSNGAIAGNGYLALFQFDGPVLGGNANGYIDAGDAIFSRLRVWIDSNHNGISEGDELFTLAQVGITRVKCEYSASGRRDQYGNLFRYKGEAWIAGPSGREHKVTTYDVFFQKVQ